MRVYSPEELIEHAEHIDSTLDSLKEGLTDMAETDDSIAKSEIRREIDLNVSLLELFAARLTKSMRDMGLSSFCGFSLLSGSMKERDASGATAR